VEEIEPIAVELATLASGTPPPATTKFVRQAIADFKVQPMTAANLQGRYKSYSADNPRKLDACNRDGR
jgi:hypothetical protein